MDAIQLNSIPIIRGGDLALGWGTKNDLASLSYIHNAKIHDDLFLVISSLERTHCMLQCSDRPSEAELI